MNFLPAEWHETLISTNTFIEEKINNQEPTPSGMVVVAHEQTAGKGRYDRKWITTKNRNLTFSFLIKTNVQQIQLPSLTMACAIGVTKALNKYGIKAMTKWPNDVLVQDKKICGILSKQIPKIDDELCYVIVGIGVNANMTDLEAMNIDRPATSILIETGNQTSVEELLDNILSEIQSSISRWECSGFESIREEWENYHKPAGTRMIVQEREHDQEGVLIGFGSYGELILRDNNGVEHSIVQGDVVYD